MNAGLQTLAGRLASTFRETQIQPDGRLRLLLLTDTPILASGGSERFLRNLIEGLEPRRYAIDVVQLCPPPPDAAPSLPVQLPVRLEYWPVDAIYGARGRALYRELRRRLLRGEYDLVQSQHEKSDLLCALLPRGPAHAQRISNRRDTGFQKSARLRLAFGLLNRRFDAVVGPAEAVLHQVRQHEGGLHCATACVPNGVDTERFRPMPPPLRQAARTALELSPETCVFACVARLVEVKRHCDLLRAYARIDRTTRPSQLWLIGDGPLRGALEQQAREAGIAADVRFLGERRDIDALLPLCDAFVLASRTEGMSNAVLEAMACGLPVVATAVGGQAELVEDGVTGLLVPARSPVRLAFALEQLLHAPVRSHLMGRQARERALERFSLGAMVAGFERLYRRFGRADARA